MALQMSKENQTLDVIRRMKREKALKILKAYKYFRFRKVMKIRIAAKKVKYF
jgi:hypothetical protein